MKVLEKVENTRIKTNEKVELEKHEEFFVEFSPFLNAL